MTFHRLPALLAAIGCGFFTLPLSASDARDVPYVVTPPAVVATMLRLAEVGPEDVLYDLGSGDGRIVIAAARDFDVKKGIGIDIDPELVSLATKNAKTAGVSDRVSFARGNIFEMDFEDATVLTLYLLPDVNVALRPRLLDLPPGTRVVSHAFNMGDWVPDGAANADMRRIYLWIVPAKVEGTWAADDGGTRYTLQLTQRYQQAFGQLNMGTRSVRVEMATIKSDAITFTAAGPLTFDGKVNGDVMTGVLHAGGRRIPLTFKQQPSKDPTDAPR